MTPATLRRPAPRQVVCHGVDALARLPELLAELGVRRPLVAVTPSLRDSRLLDRIRTLLGSRLAGVSTAVRAHVPGSSVDALVHELREARADGLVTVGGGSATDAGKAVRAVLALGSADREGLTALRVDAGDDGLDAGGTALRGRAPAQVAIPTTLSAAEFDGAFSVVQGGVKHVHGSPLLAPQAVILDPWATEETPDWLWSSTGIKALDHAVETFLSWAVTPVAEVLAPRAARLLLENLEASVRGAERGAARLRCQVAAWLSLYEVHNVPLGLSHAVGHQVGAATGMAHGLTSCVFLPAVLELLAERDAARVAELAGAMGLVPPRARTDREIATGLVDAVRELIERLGLPSTLADAGVAVANERHVVDAVLRDPVARYCPVPVTRELVTRMLRGVPR